MQLFLVLGTRDVALESLGLMNIVALVLLTLITVSFHNRRRWLVDLVSILAAAQILAHHRVLLLRRGLLFNFLAFLNELIRLLLLEL